MKVVAFNGSPRRDGNTATLLCVVLKELEGLGIETELVHLKGPLSGCIAYMFKRKVGAAVVAVRRAGAIHVFDSINHFFLINQMIIPGSSYWNIGMGLHENDVEKDAEGIEIMRTLGQNMGWLMKRIEG